MSYTTRMSHTMVGTMDSNLVSFCEFRKNSGNFISRAFGGHATCAPYPELMNSTGLLAERKKKARPGFEPGMTVLQTAD